MKSFKILVIGSCLLLSHLAIADQTKVFTFDQQKDVTVIYPDVFEGAGGVTTRTLACNKDNVCAITLVNRVAIVNVRANEYGLEWNAEDEDQTGIANFTTGKGEAFENLASQISANSPLNIVLDLTTGKGTFGFNNSNLVRF